MMIMKYLSTAPPYILINIPAGLNRYVLALIPNNPEMPKAPAFACYYAKAGAF